jgi:iron(III) transport system ATP-binding protein
MMMPTSTAPATSRLVLENVSVRYGAITALDGVSLDVAEREILCLLGPSGSGKSTLLRLVAGIERPTEGRILLEGVEVAGARRFVEPEQRRVGMVFQDYALFPHLTVADNVAFGLRGRPREEVGHVVAAMLERVSLQRYATSFPHVLSGGERQRAALARALAPGPRVLLMDEPFSSLDSRLRDEVRQQTLDLLHDTGTTTIFVTHDPDEAMRIADRIALLHDGRLVECGCPEQVYARPSTLLAARFFSDVNELCGTCRDGFVRTPLGNFAAPHLAERASARVCIRPQHLRLALPGTGVPARVVSNVFLGEVEHLSLAVHDVCTPLTLRAFGRTQLQPQDTVYLEVRPEDVLVVANNEACQPSHHNSLGAVQ